MSPPETPGVELTVERLQDGEVSPFLTGELRPGDAIELRGPIGGHFVWSAFHGTKSLLLVAGGSGIVPLMCMLRHRRLSGNRVPVALLYSCRTREEVIYHQGLGTIAHGDRSLTLRITLTRERPPGWAGAVGLIDLSIVRALVKQLGGVSDTFVCGSAGFVEAASVLLLEVGQPAHASRTERFGATGG